MISYPLLRFLRFESLGSLHELVQVIDQGLKLRFYFPDLMNVSRSFCHLWVAVMLFILGGYLDGFLEFLRRLKNLLG